MRHFEWFSNSVIAVLFGTFAVLKTYFAGHFLLLLSSVLVSFSAQDKALKGRVMDWVEQHQQRVILSLHFRSTSRSRRCAKKRWIKKAIGEAVMYSPFLGQLSRLYPSSATQWHETSRLPRQWRNKSSRNLDDERNDLGWVQLLWSLDSWGARVMALFPVKNGPQYRSENQYRGDLLPRLHPGSPKSESRLYKPYRGRWMATKSCLKWFRKHPSFTILFITWSGSWTKKTNWSGKRRRRKSRQFWVVW